MKDKIPFRVRPMLATLVGEPFHEPGWVYEEKYDGIRILAYKEGSQVTLLSRKDKDRTESFPAIARTVGALRPTTLLLDGEVIALDRHKISRFQLLQRGIGRAHYAVFDCLYTMVDQLNAFAAEVTRVAREVGTEGKPRSRRRRPSRRPGSRAWCRRDLERPHGKHQPVGSAAARPWC